jgi:2-polyprenyl-3-methyl-5-hydroxy-6-metoxy-1,4-benzoquinol methylase
LDASIRRQGEQLSSIIKGEWPESKNVLDVSCGIGTQAIALSQHGYTVVGSDLSIKEIAVKTHVMRSRYYAISISRIMELMRQAGFLNVRRIDGMFFQPVLLGTKPR